MKPNFSREWEQNIPGASSAARHDSRDFGQRFSSRVQLDEMALHNMRRAMLEGLVPLDEAISYADAQNLPPQLVQGSFLQWIPSAGPAGATLLIPKNPFRLSFLVANFTLANLILFSFDRPLSASNTIAAGVPMGSYYQEANGSVTTNDIWVFCNDPNETFPIPILGYEGQISPVGNPRGP